MAYKCPKDGNDLTPNASGNFHHCSHCGKDYPRYMLQTGEQLAQKEKDKSEKNA